MQKQHAQGCTMSPRLDTGPSLEGIRHMCHRNWFIFSYLESITVHHSHPSCGFKKAKLSSSFIWKSEYTESTLS